MRGDGYLEDLNPGRGSEQAGIRPVIIVQHQNLDRFTRKVVEIPVTTDLRRSCSNPRYGGYSRRGRRSDSRFSCIVLSNCCD